MLFLFFLWLLLSFFFPFMYSLPPVDSMASKTNLRFMSIETGSAHPLAAEPDIQLDTELSVNLLDVRLDVIGDHIVVVLVDLFIHHPESDAIHLVDRKRGRMTLVSCASCMQCGMGAEVPVLISTHLSFHPPSGTLSSEWNV
jgi:hypothetical protein